jgi:hypothetical protein
MSAYTRRIACASPILADHLDHPHRHGPFPDELGPACKFVYYTHFCNINLCYRQRNDAYDAYGTYPIHQRPANKHKDAFADGVQRTQYDIIGLLLLCNLLNFSLIDNPS